MSTRLRILLWCTLLVAFALAASVIATRVVLFRNLASETDGDLTHEFVELGLGSPFAVAPTDRHGAPENEAQLLAAFARANPSPRQELVAISDGKVLATSPSAPRYPVASDPALVNRWAAVRIPAYGTIQTSSGTVRYLAAPFGPKPAGGRAGGLDVVVAISFVDHERSDVTATVRTASIVGLLALAAAIVIAWLISGRILAPVRELSAPLEPSPSPTSRTASTCTAMTSWPDSPVTSTPCSTGSSRLSGPNGSSSTTLATSSALHSP